MSTAILVITLISVFSFAQDPFDIAENIEVVSKEDMEKIIADP